MLCSAAARTEDALGIFDIARHYAFTLFARSRLYDTNPPRFRNGLLATVSILLGRLLKNFPH